MKVLLLDNYDSFTYNLLHILRELGAQTDVVRNDKIVLDDVVNYDKIVLSPGPGIPSEGGSLLSLIERFAPTKSILGVCLGEQAIGESFGAKLINLKEVYHGIQSSIRIVGDDYIFDNMPRTIDVGRYHSWVVDRNSLPDCLTVTAEDDEGQIMALRHNIFDVRGVQFHPESVLTPIGKTIIENFLKH